MAESERSWIQIHPPESGEAGYVHTVFAASLGKYGAEIATGEDVLRRNTEIRDEAQARIEYLTPQAEQRREELRSALEEFDLPGRVLEIHDRSTCFRLKGAANKTEYDSERFGELWDSEVTLWVLDPHTSAEILDVVADFKRKEFGLVLALPDGNIAFIRSSQLRDSTTIGDKLTPAPS
jgi:hypothetical protein